ncbi:uncharacterized protein EV422DRAFT_581581 [Fimicolochytrium jonesii]|uniref:uncharacterized protein n=1 Tax=Fimicolochytrium jonesii TaxID=1396493 RepID=UPI0022FE1FCA|nr:uncharacterized protein EV422DRAFT_581581 [Fimicolochytrium jonesii]KAI8816212.1 hypothetical protein EV422DRAFT_581581 [Fimicolochytrium jonesii]
MSVGTTPLPSGRSLRFGKLIHKRLQGKSRRSVVIATPKTTEDITFVYEMLRGIWSKELALKTLNGTGGARREEVGNPANEDMALLGHIAAAAVADTPVMILGTLSPSFIHFSSVQNILDEREVGTACNIKVVTPGRDYLFAADVSTDYVEWIYTLRDAFASTPRHSFPIPKDVDEDDLLDDDEPTTARRGFTFSRPSFTRKRSQTAPVTPAPSADELEDNEDRQPEHNAKDSELDHDDDDDNTPLGTMGTEFVDAPEFPPAPSEDTIVPTSSSDPLIVESPASSQQQQQQQKLPPTAPASPIRTGSLASVSGDTLARRRDAVRREAVRFSDRPDSVIAEDDMLALAANIPIPPEKDTLELTSPTLDTQPKQADVLRTERPPRPSTTTDRPATIRRKISTIFGSANPYDADVSSPGTPSTTPNSLSRKFSAFFGNSHAPEVSNVENYTDDAGTTTYPQKSATLERGRNNTKRSLGRKISTFFDKKTETIDTSDAPLDSVTPTSVTSPTSSPGVKSPRSRSLTRPNTLPPPVPLSHTHITVQELEFDEAVYVGAVGEDAGDGEFGEYVPEGC